MDNLSLEPKMAGREMYEATDAAYRSRQGGGNADDDGSDGANLTTMAATVMMAATETKTMRQFRSEMSWLELFRYSL